MRLELPREAACNTIRLVHPEGRDNILQSFCIPNIPRQSSSAQRAHATYMPVHNENRLGHKQLKIELTDVYHDREPHHDRRLWQQQPCQP